MTRKIFGVFIFMFIFVIISTYAHAYSLYLEDASFVDKISAEYQMTYYGNSNSKGVLDVKITNHSSVVDIDGILITPFMTSFLFNLPDSAYIKAMNVFDITSGSQTQISGWTLPYVGKKKTIPSPDNHGFWDAGASIGKLFTSGSPDDGIAPNATYLFKFFLEGSYLADLSVETILAEEPSFGGSGGGAGSGSGGGGGSVLPTSDEAEGGPPSLDWGDGPYFLANLKGAPEGAFDFGLLVPEDVVFPQITGFKYSGAALFAATVPESFQVVATPEPSTLALMGLGGLGAVLALRKRRSTSS